MADMRKSETGRRANRLVESGNVKASNPTSMECDESGCCALILAESNAKKGVYYCSTN